MGEVTEYPEGTFCWVDLGTPDVAGARAFYGEVFGWEMVDTGPRYTLCRRDGRDVTGIHQHAEEEGAHWSSYVNVRDADATAAAAAELGATVEVEPSDVPGTSRVAALRDPTGAAVALWQPMGFIGAGLVNEIGSWTWNELATPDVDRARSFYTGLFGWTAQDIPGPLPRVSLQLGDLLIGGMHMPTEAEAAAGPGWTVTFRVADADATAEGVRRLGGRVLLPPMDIPVGRFSIVADPLGVVFTISAVPGGPLRGVDGS
jgi:predicted enzyme related to lactoylglutathione lyase